MALNSRKFEGDKKKKINLSDFSFSETQELLKDWKTSFAYEYFLTG